NRTLAGPQGYRRRRSLLNPASVHSRNRLAAGGLVLRSGYVPGRQIEAGVLRPGRRRRQFHGRNDERALGIGRIQAFRYLERRSLGRSLIFLAGMTMRIQAAEDMAAAQKRARDHGHGDSQKIHAARSSSVTPAARIARSTVSWCAG